MSSTKPKSLVALTVLTVLAALIANDAQAVPAFARQTHLDCTVCHLSWPELTSVGRQFKLNGYTLGERQPLPIAGMLQLSRTSSAKADVAAADNLAKDKDLVLQQASIFVAGKVTEHVGGFVQWSYDGIEHHSGVDNVDLRYADHLDTAGRHLIYGATLHNNPLVQDVYNATPTWGFPFASSAVAASPAAATVIESLGQQVVGVGGYALWDNTLYGEVIVYRTADRVFSLLRAGTSRADAAALKGGSPYWRLALQHEWNEGTHSAMIGAYGLNVDRYPDNTNPVGATDRFKDIGLDTQYQYITDRHRLSLQFNAIREQQDWMATAQSNATDQLRTTRAKVTYYFQKKYGVTVAHFAIKGTADNALYNTDDPLTGSASGSPNSHGYIAELNYLPKRDIRLVLQYTAYGRFNGARANYDGFGRDAKDNNTLYLVAWFMF